MDAKSKTFALGQWKTIISIKEESNKICCVPVCIKASLWSQYFCIFAVFTETSQRKRWSNLFKQAAKQKYCLTCGIFQIKLKANLFCHVSERNHHKMRNKLSIGRSQSRSLCSPPLLLQQVCRPLAQRQQLHRQIVGYGWWWGVEPQSCTFQDCPQFLRICCCFWARRSEAKVQITAP